MSHENSDEKDGAGAEQPGIRIGGLLRALRRHLALSQRGLAGRLDVSAGTLGRWESGRRAPTLPELERALALAGWRFVVVDGQGVVVDPMRPDAVVDRSGRRYPAHAEVRPVPPGGDGWGRRSPDQWAPQIRRTADGVPEIRGKRRRDHPSAADVANHQEAMRLVQKWRKIAEQEARRYARMVSGEWAADVMECLCPMACFDNRLCVDWCPCQCEPEGLVARGSAYPN